MKIVFVSFLKLSENPLLGIPHIIAALAAAHPDYELDHLYFSVSASTDKVSENLIVTNADFIGFSLFGIDRDFITKIVEGIHKNQPACILFNGGWATADLAAYYFDPNYFRFAIAGEGESATIAAIEAVLAGTSLKNIPGVLSLENMEPSIIREDVSKLISPWTSGYIDRFEVPMPWEVSRGCNRKCIYCVENRQGTQRQNIPMPRLLEELNCIISYSAITIVDVVASNILDDMLFLIR